jgi:hypothetical protein
MNKSLSRKVTYILAIIALLLPLYALGRPKAGAISQLRNRHNIGQTYLGQLDPTSESMRLATLGMKGIASSILWLKADYYKEEKYFDRFSATLNQIALLQPHFISVWQHQAHNMSFNVSPEFEDYRQRYEWVKKGIDYLVRGTKYNERKPILQYDLGHYVGNKIGKFDEKKQYRELFRKDTEFHNYFTEQGLPVETNALGYDQRPDNWRVGKLWFNRAVESFQAGNKIAKTPHLLYCYSPLWQMYYGESIQNEGILDDRSKFAWEQGGREWAEYGKMSIPWSGDGQIKLLDVLADADAIREKKAELDKQLEDARAKIKERRFARLPQDLKDAFQKPEKDRSITDSEKASEAERLINPTATEAIAEAPKDQQPRLLQLSTEISRMEEKLRIANIYRSNVNYAYWETRARAEQKQYTVDARRLLYNADKMIDAADIKGALDNYEQAWKLWDAAFKRFPILMTEDVGEDVLKSIGRYNKLTESTESEDFILKWFVDFRKAYNQDQMSFDVEQMLAIWNARAAELGDDADFTESQLMKDLQKGMFPANDSNETKDQAEPTQSKEPAADSPQSTSEAPTAKEPNATLNRPPQLENPESPN